MSPWTLCDKPTTIPSRDRVWLAPRLCPANKTKVVILGQDPYPDPELAMGLAFSVPKGLPIPASLRNVFKELVKDLGVPFPTSGDLTPWAEQGVLLLNRVLTTEMGKSGAHVGLGWEEKTEEILEDVLHWNRPLVIIAWGALAAQALETIQLSPNALLLVGGHPSPLNRSAKTPFAGGRYFSKANLWLEARGVAPIDWRLP